MVQLIDIIYCLVAREEVWKLSNALEYSIKNIINHFREGELENFTHTAEKRKKALNGADFETKISIFINGILLVIFC